MKMTHLRNIKLILVPFVLMKIIAGQVIPSEDGVPVSAYDLFDIENSEELFDPMQQSSQHHLHSDYVSRSSNSQQQDGAINDNITESQSLGVNKNGSSGDVEISTTVSPTVITRKDEGNGEYITTTFSSIESSSTNVNKGINKKTNLLFKSDGMMDNDDSDVPTLTSSASLSSSLPTLSTMPQMINQNHLILPPSPLFQERQTRPDTANVTSDNVDTVINYNYLIAAKNESIDFSNNEHQDQDDDDDADADLFDKIEKKPMSTAAPHSITTPITTTIAATMTTSASLSPTMTKLKQGKHIKLDKPPPEEIIRTYFEDIYLRLPLAILVDTSQESLQKTKSLWNGVLKMTNSTVDVVLIAFNSSGVGVSYTFKNARTMMAGLNSIKESESSPMHNKVFEGIIRAIELIPYDSAIFLCTDTITTDWNLSQIVGLTMLKKRIRLHLIWFTKIVNDTKEIIDTPLGRISLQSGGGIFIYNEEFSIDNGEVGLVSLILRNDLQGSQEIDSLLDDTTITNLQQIDISGQLEESTVETASGVNYFDDVEDFALDNDNENGVLYQAQYSQRQELSESDIDDAVFNKIDVIDVAKENHAATLETITMINIGTNSQLLPSPGTTAVVYFEVTNLRNQAIVHNFQVVDEQRYLRTINPSGGWIGPGQTITVAVTLIIPAIADVGTRDKITFSSQSVGTTTQSVYVTVSSSATVQDAYQPSLYWTFGSRCEWKSSAGTCASAVWSLEITAQDYETGILRVQSSPRGLLVRNNFVAGTREPVTATYSASCCQPRVTITAYDLARNQRSVTIDVNDIWLSGPAIAAIVLGVLLLIVLIILLVICIRWCVQRNRMSRDLPVYRSERTRVT